MTVYAVVTCDGTRLGQPCRAAFTLPQATDTDDATARAVAAGWRMDPHGFPAVLCPSPGHDQEPTPHE
jgi:hypothetical protein